MDKMYFTEEHEFFRKSFQDFLQKEVVPHIDKWEKTGQIERFIWEKFGRERIQYTIIYIVLGTHSSFQKISKVND